LLYPHTIDGTGLYRSINQDATLSSNGEVIIQKSNLEIEEALEELQPGKVEREESTAKFLNRLLFQIGIDLELDIYHPIIILEDERALIERVLKKLESDVLHDNRELCIRIGNVLWHHGKEIAEYDIDSLRSKSKSIFEQALKYHVIANSSGGDETSFRNLAIVLHTLEDHERSLEFCEMIQKTDAQMLLIKALNLLALGRVSESLAIIDKALDTCESPDFLVDAARLLDSAGRTEEALETLDEALSMDERNGKALLLEFALLMKLGMTEEAKENIRVIERIGILAIPNPDLTPRYVSESDIDEESSKARQEIEIESEAEPSGSGEAVKAEPVDQVEELKAAPAIQTKEPEIKPTPPAEEPKKTPEVPVANSIVPDQEQAEMPNVAPSPPIEETKKVPDIPVVESNIPHEGRIEVPNILPGPPAEEPKIAPQGPVEEPKKTPDVPEAKSNIASKGQIEVPDMVPDPQISDPSASRDSPVVESRPAQKGQTEGPKIVPRGKVEDLKSASEVQVEKPRSEPKGKQGELGVRPALQETESRIEVADGQTVLKSEHADQGVAPITRDDLPAETAKNLIVPSSVPGSNKTDIRSPKPDKKAIEVKPAVIEARTIRPEPVTEKPEDVPRKIEVRNKPHSPPTETPPPPREPKLVKPKGPKKPPEKIPKVDRKTAIKKSKDVPFPQGEAPESEPTSAESWLDRAKAFELLERYDEALDSYDEMLKINERDIRTWMQKIELLKKLGQFEAALDSFTRLIKVFPAKDIFKNQKGRLLLAMGMYDKAALSFNSILEKNPENIPWARKARPTSVTIQRQRSTQRMLEHGTGEG
jgi:tetratricopeptide (TPR) repeat protein